MATIYYKQNREWKKIQGLGGGGGSGATINRTALYNLLLAGDGINIIDTDDLTNKVLVEVNAGWKPTYSDSFLVGSEGSENMKMYAAGKLSYANPVQNFTYKLPITSGTSGETYELLATSNVKTFFGSQSIVGSGNIDLYLHNICFTSTDQDLLVKFRFTVPSSNNINVNSLTALKTLLGNTFTYPVSGANSTNGKSIYEITETGFKAGPSEYVLYDTITTYPAGTWTDDVKTL